MPTVETTHQWTAADNELEVSGKMCEPDRPLTWLRDEGANTDLLSVGHAWDGVRSDTCGGRITAGHDGRRQ
jgi:hypothetical protein